MRDYNFFEPFLKERKNTGLKLIYGGIVASLIVGIMAVTYLYQIFEIRGLENDIKVQKQTINSPKLKEIAIKRNKTQKKLDILKKYSNQVENTNKITIEEDNINTLLIKSISNKLPTEISFQSMIIKDNNISIQGTSQNRTAIAELIHNLKSTDEFNEVYVGGISNLEKEENEIKQQGYSFNITFELKGECSSEGE
ncbi:PilN domain-containing protein [Clostridium aestuarii]|uniref:PilN domain-containing protein n=1 Tax=Clostridium aestuarii TaxID=338193 RepID=A0ABT4D1R9_9CLOT|nr:PilN domain-containing protein [Clostridium aestuarii]MCY6484582.1 PilN domain-containing protein [Clostridium aestuarii]